MLWLFVLSSKAFLNMFYTDMSGLAAQEWGQKERTQVLSLFFFFFVPVPVLFHRHAM